MPKRPYLPVDTLLSVFAVVLHGPVPFRYLEQLLQFLSVFGEVAHHAVGIRSGQGDDNLRPGIYVVSCDGRRFGRLRIELYDEDVAVAQDEVFEGARIDTRNVELRFHLIEHRNGFEQYRTERVAHFAVPELLVDGYDYLVRFSAGVVEIARAALRFAGEHQAGCREQNGCEQCGCCLFHGAMVFVFCLASFYCACSGRRRPERDTDTRSGWRRFIVKQRYGIWPMKTTTAAESVLCNKYGKICRHTAAISGKWC